MKCFVNVKTKREFEIFLLYCLKNDIRFRSGELIVSNFSKGWLNTGVAFYFNNDKFDRLTCAEIGYGEQYSRLYKKVAFQDIFKETKQIDIE